MAVETDKTTEQIQKLKEYLPESSKQELEEILRYWEGKKVQGKRKKNQFWRGYTISEFRKLLKYRRRHKKELEMQYKYLDKMKNIEREKFIEEYLYDDILYGCADVFKSEDNKSNKYTEYNYRDWKEWKVEIGEWTILEFSGAFIWDEWIENISKVVLEDWVCMNLRRDQIMDAWAILIAKNMKLKEWVTLDLGHNRIWDEWAEAISRMKTKEWVKICLNGNEIWDIWAQAIIDNMEFKDWVHIDLRDNCISDEMKKKLWNFSFCNKLANFIISV